MLISFRLLDQVLRGERTRLADLRDGEIDVSVRQLAGVLLLLGLLYGLCMGLFSVILSGGTSYWQLLATIVKVPLLFFLTLLVTFPSLYVFNALVGSRLKIHSVLRLLTAATGVMLAVLAAFGTIVAFFSVSSTSYHFMLLLNVAVFTVSGVLGLAFLFRSLQRLTVSQEPAAAPPPLPPETSGDAEGTWAAKYGQGALDRLDDRPPGVQVRLVFRIWVLLFSLVGAQMGWVLRPFIGHPDMPFSFFRPRSSNFFEAVFQTLRTFLGA
jgi:hypothetical protein